MTDTVLKGTGNSRVLRSVSNFLTLYPNYNAFAQAVVNGTLPIDIGNLQSSGVSTSGTPYNKANVLPNATCTALGIPTTSVPKDAFDKLATLVKTAQETADAAQATADLAVKIMSGSYTGTGSPDADTKTLTFSSPWTALFLLGYKSTTPSTLGPRAWFFRDYIYGFKPDFQLGYYTEIGDKSIKITRMSSTSDTGPNALGYTYYWYAI